MWRKKSGFSKFGINLLHSYLMRIKMFCLLELNLIQIFHENDDSEWLEGRSELYCIWLIHLCNVLN